MEEEKINQQQPESMEKPEEKSVEKKIRPKIFSKPTELIDVVVTAYYSKENGDFQFVIPNRVAPEEESEASENFIVMEHIFTFSPVPYNRLNIYRTRSGKYNEQDKTTTLDFIRLRDFLWTFHLQDWNLEDEEGNKVPVIHDPDGTLSDETAEKLWQIPSMILDMVISSFERKIHVV